MDGLNGGGWGCIYSHQPLPSRCSILLSADGPPAWSGRSAPVDQRLKTQRSAVTAISTAISHLMRRQMSDKASRGRSARLARTVRACRSTAENATVSSNGYINGYIAFNASSDVRLSQSRTVRSCTLDGPRGRYNSFFRTRHLRVFRNLAYRTVRA